MSYGYPGQTTEAVTQLALTIQAGEFVGILGADEAGKTTLAKLTNGLLRPSSGQLVMTPPAEAALILDAHTDEDTLYAIRQVIGVIFSDPENQLVASTVEEEVAFGPGNLQLPAPEIRRRVAKYLHQVGLFEAAKRSPHELSGGEQQKLCIAGVLAMEPACVVLDEPLTFLDSPSRTNVLHLLQQLHAAGQTIVYLTSDPAELRFAQRILVLRHGVIRRDLPAETFWHTPDVFADTDIPRPDLLRLRDELRQRGYSMPSAALTPAAVAHDLTGLEDCTQPVSWRTSWVIR